MSILSDSLFFVRRVNVYECDRRFWRYFNTSLELVLGIPNAKRIN